MVKGRMLEIIKYLDKERMASYKEIADALGLKERNVRYDITAINNELSLKKAPLIEKYSKGMLFVPDDLDFSIITEDQEFVFSPQERLDIIRIQVLFDTEHINLRALSDKLQVSRRSVQNDLETIQEEICSCGLQLEYSRKFHLKGESEAAWQLRCKVLRPYVKLLHGKKKFNAYEIYIRNLLLETFQTMDIDAIFQWIRHITETMNWIFSDESFLWYVANVLVFTWYLKNDKELPQKSWKEEGEIDPCIASYEHFIGRSLTGKERGILSGFSKYTNRYENLDVNLDLLATEDLTLYLVRQMSASLQMHFSRDGILLKGLLNHIGPMLERIRDQVQLHDEAKSLVPEEYHYVYEALGSLLDQHPILQKLTENERVYLTIYFLGSLRRMQQALSKTVLLICGFGYGTTAVVKDALLNEYQVYVRDSIPAYKVQSYAHWDDIDVVISTVKVELPQDKPHAQVNVIFKQEDYVKLDLLGIRRKGVLTNYFSIERRLDFLNPADRERVMNVIKEELGYKEVRMPAKYYTLSDLLHAENILCVDQVPDWREAVNYCTGILKEHGCIEDSYRKNIIRGMEVQGFYSVTDQTFALLHGNEKESVNVSCMSLLISQKPVSFGDKQANIIFCLASRDKKEHVPAIIRLMRMVSMTDFIESLKTCTSTGEAVGVINRCEKEVEICYQS